MSKISIVKDVKNVVVVDSDHGGYEAGHCIACDASGWLGARNGYPYAARTEGSHLKHKKDCPMNAVLNNDGSFKKALRQKKSQKEK